MTQAAEERDDSQTQRAQVFCSICKKSMAVEVPVPEFCDCPHCGAHFAAGGDLAPKTPDPPHITQGPKKPTSESRQKTIPDAKLPSPRSEEIRTLPDAGPFAPSGKPEKKENRRALYVAAAFIVVAAASFLGGSLTREKESSDDSPESASKEASEGTAPACTPRQAVVANTGNFQGAKLRSKPGFEHPQASIITKGANISICEKAETPGTKIPNVWYRLTDGKHEGLWIHANTLKLN